MDRVMDRGPLSEAPSSVCPCGSGRGYDGCCGIYLGGVAQPPDPERLMRSRYTAFCRGDADYLMATMDSENSEERPEIVRQELDRAIAETQWLGLRVLGSGTDGTDRGWVEFAAFYRQADHLHQLHERSAFFLREGRWLYRDGRMLPPLQLGRNEPCFCGSNKKYKKCHGK